MSANTYIANAHPTYIENLYQEYQSNTESVDLGWRRFFEGFEFALKDNGSKNGTTTAIEGAHAVHDKNYEKELKVFSLIYTYRKNAHLASDTNPIRERVDRKPNLHLEAFGLSEADLDSEFNVGKELNLGRTKLSAIIDRLKEIYCRTIGLETSYINDPEKRHWIRSKFENIPSGFGFTIEEKTHILRKLNSTTVFEKFLGTKYLGEKRFSLEGGESAIPAIDAMINTAGDLGLKEVAIGMAHRGRLNVLVNIMGKTYKHIFNEFEGNTPEDLTMGDGDVKYHLGYSSIVKTPKDNEVHLKLSPNPSHLEAVDPVVLGFARAKADVIYNSEYDSILPILIHGDAAVAGQGVVYEVAQMSKLKGYYTGGTIHFVINNQIGFTTDFDDARSSNYSTSVASVIEAPVIHVNGDDVEAVVYASKVAAEYRQKFNSDIYVDMVCYRKHGHNEGDDPQYTQPQMYAKIKKHDNPRDIYTKKLTQSGDITAELAKKLNEEFWQELQDRLDEVRQQPLPYNYQEPEQAWRDLEKATPKDFEKSPSTKISKKETDHILKSIFTIPKDFGILRKMNKMLNRQHEVVKKDQTLDWAAAELLAYGSILKEGRNIRMSGQDVKRGTFSHRHAVLTDEKTEAEYNRLSNLSDKQGQFFIYNSLLSEFAVLGFEFGYSMASPDHLVIWEAQFGDFSNGAQTIIDQFITSSESKWQRNSGLVMLLPHGYEGQGPEHSSARLERFLQAGAEENISICNITTPANFFHALRRQLVRPFRKPLVVMSPKSLLRHKRCISPISEVTKGGFQEILVDNADVSIAKTRKVLFCSGKIYYDLQEYKEANKIKDIAIVRLEQLYPLPQKQLDSLIKKYKNADLMWVQEEPANMGAWSYLISNYDVARKQFDCAGRKASASPATGFKKVHLKEQQAIMEKAFN